MNPAKVTGLVVAGVTVACVAFSVALLLIKALWAWTVPDLFPGAVADGLIAAQISWLAAAKVALVVAVVSGISGSNTGAHSHAA